MYAGKEHKKTVNRVIQQPTNKSMSQLQIINRKVQSKTKSNLSFNPSIKNRVAQRLIGLEFETSNLNVLKHKKDYKTKIAEGNGFDVTIDNGNIEIVTKPFQASGKEQLKRAVQKSVDGIMQLPRENCRLSYNDKYVVNPNKPFPQTNKTFLECEIKQVGTVKAHPQATMGIPLNALFSVYEMLSQQSPTIKLSSRNVELPHFSLQKGKQSKWEPMRTHMQIAINEINERNDLSSKLKGLFAQVLITINSINDDDFIRKAGFNGSHNVWKNQFVLMPKTKLSHLYDLLDENDKQEFKSWVEKISDDKIILENITISEWLKGLVGLETKELATEDLQIEGLGSNELDKIAEPKNAIQSSMKAIYESMNSIPTNINTKNNPVNEGGIFEFRHLKGSVDLNEWPSVAEEAASIAEWVEEIRSSSQTVQSETGGIFALTECSAVPSDL